MRDRLESSIEVSGWDAQVDAASQALSWVLDGLGRAAALEQFLRRPEDERRTEWILRGGDPQNWPGPACGTPRR
jgi:hypothetical protein